MSFLINRIVRTSEEWFGGSDSYRVIYLLYAVCGVWMLRRKYFDKNIYVYVTLRFLQVFAVIACLVCLVSFVYDAYLMRHNIEKLSYNLTTSIFFMMALLRFLFLIIKKDGLEGMLEVINHNLYLDDVGRCSRDIDILKNGEQEFKNIAKAFYSLLVVGVASRVACHVFSVKSLPIPFPYVEKIGSPYYEIIFVFEGFAFIHFVFEVISQEMVTFGIFIRVSRHFMILSENIYEVRSICDYKSDHPDLNNKIISKKFGAKEDFKWQQEKIFFLLKKSIIHHQEILKVIHKTRYLLQESFFIQIVCGGLLLAELFFHVTLQQGNSSLMLLCQFIYSGSALLDITIMCYYGSEIQTRSHDAANALYFIPWLQMDVKNRQTLRFFQMALRKYSTIKTGFFFSISLHMYLKFLNSIYRYLAFLQNTLKRTE